MKVTQCIILLAVLCRCGPDSLQVSPEAAEFDEESVAVQNLGSAPTAIAHQLPGFQATVLAADSDGQLAILNVGAKGTRVAVTTKFKRAPVSVRSRAGKFYLLYDTGTVVVVNAATGAVESSVASGLKAARDLEFGADGSLYVSSSKAAEVWNIDVAGKKKASIALNAVAPQGFKSVATTLIRVGNQLFVGVSRLKDANTQARAAVAVVDTSTNTVKKVLELEGVTMSGESVRPGLNARLPMVFDATRNAVLVPVGGVRPSNTGMLFRVDAKALAITRVDAANSGFQGQVLFAPNDSKLFIVYHTSTPSDSSHLFDNRVATDGTLAPTSEGALIDTFDGVDALDVNAAKTLVGMANGCAAGFCIGGAGINFINAKTSEILPKLMASDIGFEPSLIAFAQ